MARARSWPARTAASGARPRGALRARAPASSSSGSASPDSTPPYRCQARRPASEATSSSWPTSTASTTRSAGRAGTSTSYSALQAAESSCRCRTSPRSTTTVPSRTTLGRRFPLSRRHFLCCGMELPSSHRPGHQGHGHAGFQRVRPAQGGGPQLCVQPAPGPGAAADQGQCPGARRDLDARLARIGRIGGVGPGDAGTDGRRDAPRALSTPGREQIRGRRLRPGLGRIPMWFGVRAASGRARQIALGVAAIYQGGVLTSRSAAGATLGLRGSGP